MPLNDLTQVRQFMTGNGLFAFFDAPWMPIYIIVLFIFHPAFGFFAIFAAIVLVGITIANEYSTKDKLAEANNLSLNQLANLLLYSNPLPYDANHLIHNQLFLTSFLYYLTLS